MSRYDDLTELEKEMISEMAGHIGYLGGSFPQISYHKEHGFWTVLFQDSSGEMHFFKGSISDICSAATRLVETKCGLLVDRETLS